MKKTCLTIAILPAVYLCASGLWRQPECVLGQEPSTHTAPKHTNALVDSTSPYLLQHAHNPVNWMQWGPEAFAKAVRENKPVFVSIGYSTCYWCHVMERQSFEDENVAAVLNENYIAIKVDREQRPDIDEQLMLATQLVTGRGGWPNSVWLTTDGRPWMAGTYFPKAAFVEALEQLSEVWKSDAVGVEKQAKLLSDAVREAAQVANPLTDNAPSEQALLRAVAELSVLFDEQNGGFGSKPKFPPHGGLQLLAYAARNDNSKAQTMMLNTLDAMWRGGLHDHIGGGFHRYSTDERWLLPHFEKMLYDNSQLLSSFSDAFELTQNESYRAAATDIFAWLKREMTSDSGAFYSALDSESEGEEGRFNTWSVDEIREVLGATTGDSLCRIYNCTEEGNYVEEATRERTGRNVLFLSSSIDDEPWLKDARAKLLAARDVRPRPHLDDKVLTDWNSLMIAALARAGDTFSEPRFTNAAARAANFLLENLRSKGTLKHCYRSGTASVPGYLDDYAFLIEGLMELHRVTGQRRWLDEARTLADEMLDKFEDTEAGGFFFTGDEHEELLMRSKNLLGGGNIPSGNGVAILALIDLHQSTGEARYQQSARRALNAFSGVLKNSPRQVEHVALAAAKYAELYSGQEVDSSPASHQDAAVKTTLSVTRAERPLDQNDSDSGIQGVEANDKVNVEVRFEITEGYRLYGSTQQKRSDETASIQPVEVRWLTQSDTQSQPSEQLWQQPVGVRSFDEILGFEVMKYTGTITFQTVSKLPRAIADSRTEAAPETTESPLVQVQVEIRYQACDQTRCLEPTEFVLRAPIAKP